MAIFKCKMCGGALDIKDGSSVAVCSFCGTKQTIPKLDNETRANLYDRANHFRRNNDYDKAMSIYEQLLEADKTDAEAYWSIVLCKYGIEYVEDPKTRKMVPTINRAQYTSIFADEDYKSALRYADGYQRTIYEGEAKELDKIQKGILAISQKEEPFDVFICYKETDVYGRRTHDSVLAQDLYFQLKQEGFKVFFSRITLEDKLGVAYEPYIFAALNTAKVMVVVGTSKENLNAVWVKNEWSRFLALIKKDSSKVLIPAYRDMDPYDLPEEFSHLQAQDMSKLGFMQDLIRGIKKLARPTKPQQTVVVEKVGATPENTDALIKRAFLFLEDTDWATANKYAERVLDINPECSKAYFVKLLAELHIRKPELLSKFDKNLLDYSNFKKAVRFADASERETLANYNKDVANNIKQAANERIYAAALKRVAVPSNEKDLKQSISDLRSISGYKDADAKAAELEKRLENFLKKKREAEEKARIKAEEEKIRLEKLAEEQRKKARRRKKITSIAACVLVFVIVFSVLIAEVFVPMGQMDKADKLLREGKIDEAMAIYLEQSDTEEGAAKYKALKVLKFMANVATPQNVYYGDIYTILDIGVKVKINYSHDIFVEKSIKGTKEDKWIVYEDETEWQKDGLLTPVKPGYAFKSWKFVGYGMDKQDRIELTFKPIWTPVEYSITYNLNGGVNASNNPSTYTIETESFMIMNPTREGYIFEGWTSSTINTPTKGVIIEKGTIGNITLTAHWAAADYAVYLDTRGGAGVPSSIGVEYGRSYTLPIPERTGYTFVGWYRKDNGKLLPQTGTWQLTSNINLYAVWEELTYNITYDLNGGYLWLPNPSTYTISQSTSITREPTKTGYTFLGWTYVGQQTPIKNLIIEAGNTGNITLTANWQVNTYTITYDANGGEVSPAIQNVVYGSEYTLVTPTRIGYDFAGWLYNDTIQADGVWSLTTSPTFVAQWTAISYSISYELNGGSAVLWVNPTSYTIESSKTIHNPTKTGYTFLGWTHANLQTPTKNLIIEAGNTGNITLTANWQVNTYTITYDANGGEVSPATQNVVYGTEYTLATPTRVGYDFGGWLYNDNLQVDGIWSLIANPTFVAQWTATPYNITYELNGGSVVIFVNPTAYTIESSRVIYPPTKTGYTFLGWTWEGQTEPVLSVTIPAGSTGDKHYIANWQVNTYTITYDANGGEVSPATQNVVYGTEYTLATPTRVGYDFGGWLYNDTIQTDGVWSSTTNPTFVAQWTATSYNITYELNGGGGALAVLNPKTYTIESSKTLYRPTKTGYTFLGWTYEGQTTPVTSATIPVGSTGDKHYIANWQANTYTITYDANGGEVSHATQDVVFGTEYKLAIPTRTGYDFAGWLYNDTIQTDGVWNIATNPTFVAQWTVKAEMQNFEFTSAATTCEITAVKDEAITSVLIPSYVSSIGSSVFSGCTSLKDVYYTGDIAGWCGIIFKNYFSNPMCYASNLHIDGKLVEGELVIPNGVTTIPTAAFHGCSSLTSIVIPDSVACIGDWAFYICTNLSNVTFGEHSQLTSIGDNSFQVCNSLTNITIPDRVTSIGIGAFGVCSSLTRVTFGEGSQLTNMGGNAFIGCTALESITIPDSVTNIGADAFSNCSNLTKVTIDDIASWCNIDFGNSTANPLFYAVRLYLGEDEVTDLVIPDGITEIKPYAFYNCSDLTSITIHDGVTSIGQEAFRYCANIVEATMPTTAISHIPQDNLKTVVITSGSEIDGSAFNNCSSLTNITISDSVTTIGNYAFRECTSLASVTFGENSQLTSIGNGAFDGCTSLTNIAIPDSVTSIGSGAFSGCSSLESMTIPFVGAKAGVTSSSTYQYPLGYIFGTNSYEGGVATNQRYYGSTTSITTNSVYYIPASLSSVTVAGEYVPYGAFYNCSNIESISFGEGVTADVTSAFYGCSGLTYISVDENNATYTSIDGNLYSKDGKTIVHYAAGKDENYFAIPDGVTTIGAYAFYYCNKFTSILIPDSVTSIGGYAFDGCNIVEAMMPTIAISHIPQDNLKTVVITSGTSIGSDAFYGCSSLESITIPESVTSIGEYAFIGCSSLESITIPDSVTSIDRGAFSGCTGLISITISDSLRSLGLSAFYNCTSLTDVYYLGDIAGWCGIGAVEEVSTPMYYADNLYIDGELLTEAVIPDTVAKINKYTFYNCNDLTNVVIPGSVTSIETEAFRGCSGLTSIEIPDSVTSIGSGAFSGCSSLESITIPFVGAKAGVTSRDTYQYPFGYIFGTNSYTGGTKVAPWFYCTSTSTTRQETYYIPSTLRSVTVTGGNILYGAFMSCSMLNDITITDGVTSIGEYAFPNCSSLINIIIPDSVTSIGNAAFYNCDSLTSVTFGANSQLTTIGSSAFRNCTSLTNIAIPDSVRSMGAAFSGCSSLESMTIPFVGAKAGVTSSSTYQYPLGYLFGTENYTGGTEVKQNYYGSSTSGTTNSTYYIPSSLRSVTVTGGNILWGAFYNCSMLTSITVPDSVTIIHEYAFYGCSSLTSITIPDSVTGIGKYAFYECSSLTSVTFEENSQLTSIGELAFLNCSSLASITVPDSVTSIGNYAFDYCTSLATIIFGENSQLTSIGESAFISCSSLESITIPDSVTTIGNYAFQGCTSLTSITFGDNSQLTSIGNYVFSGCSSLESITIPDAVTSIGRNAFRYCSGLTSIRFEDTTTWYRTDYESKWSNKTGGTEMDVTDASTNATCFTSTYADYYWYKV